MNTKPLFPNEASEFRAALKRAIEHFQGSPVTNENKLNESMARALGYSNYNKLAPSLAEYADNIASGKLRIEYIEDDDIEGGEPAINTLRIDFEYTGDQANIIGDARIPVSLSHEEIIKFIVSEREDRLEDLYRFALEARNSRNSSDLNLIKSDIKYLERSSEEYVLEYYGTNGFVAADLEPNVFNEECLKALKAAKEYRPDNMTEADYEEYLAGIESATFELEDYMSQH